MEEPRQLTRFDCWLLLVLAGLAVATFFIPWPDGHLRVWFLDIGQGDAIFIQTPAGEQILVDGGPPGGGLLAQLGQVMPFYDRSIDMIVSTHPDADHLGGLVDLLGQYKVDEILETGMVCDTALCKQWGEEKQATKTKVEHIVLGQEIKLSSQARLVTLHPFVDEGGQKITQTNNGGIVLKLLYGQQSLLLTADVEKPIEDKKRISNVNIDSDFIKVGHHGSKSSSTEAFLQTVSPLVAFIQVGAKNSYGHPTAEVLDRLAKKQIPSYLTSKQGSVELILDGKNYSIKTTK